MRRRRPGSDPAVAGAITTLSTDLPAYSGVVQEANFSERQANYPLAAAYLAEANNLMRTSILPAAAQVYGTEVKRLADDQGNAASTLLTVLAVVAFVALLAALVLAQRWLSGRFHRTWNVALAGATVLVVVLGLWAGVALLAENSGVASAENNGSRPVSTFTDARILALRARADDELTLLTRDSDTSYQKDYASTAAALKGLLAENQGPNRGSDPSERRQSARALSAWDAYSSVHQQVRHADSSGDLTSAVALASAPGARGLPAVSADLNGALATGIVGSQDTFVTTTSGAASDLGRVGLGARPGRARGRCPGAAWLRLPSGGVSMRALRRTWLEGRNPGRLVAGGLVLLAATVLGACGTTTPGVSASPKPLEVLPKGAEIVHPSPPPPATPATPRPACRRPPRCRCRAGCRPVPTWRRSVARGYLRVGVDQSTYLWGYAIPRPAS